MLPKRAGQYHRGQTFANTVRTLVHDLAHDVQDVIVLLLTRNLLQALPASAQP